MEFSSVQEVFHVLDTGSPVVPEKPNCGLLKTPLLVGTLLVTP